MRYLTYEEYKKIGGELEVTAFNKKIDLACSIVDSHTFNRLREMRVLPENLKPCIRDIIDYVSSNDFAKPTISSKSQSAGAVSESVSYVTKDIQSTNDDIENIIYCYLSNVTDDYFVPLLYKGCCR